MARLLKLLLAATVTFGILATLEGQPTTTISRFPRFTTAGRPTCNATRLGHPYFDLTTSLAYVCDGTNYLLMSGGGGGVGFVPTTLGSNAVNAADSIWGATNSLVFEGATADDFETSIAPTDPTADQVITFPDDTGTVALLDGSTTQIFLADLVCDGNAVFSLGVGGVSCGDDTAGASLIVFEGDIADAFEGVFEYFDNVSAVGGGSITAYADYANFTPGAWILTAAQDKSSTEGTFEVHGTPGALIAASEQFNLVYLAPINLNNTGGEYHVLEIGALTNDAQSSEIALGVQSGYDFLLVWEGTANAFQTYFAITDPTADQTITFPNASGTIVLSTLATNAPEVANSVWGASNALVFEGATENGFETSLTVTDPTADQTITFPNVSGTVMVQNATSPGYYMFPAYFELSSLGSQSPIDSLNQVWVYRVFIPSQIVVDRIIFELRTGVDTKKCSVGVYNSAGTTLLVSTGALSCAVADQGVLNTDVTNTTLQPGWYILAFTADHASIAVLIDSHNAQESASLWLAIFNATTVHVGIGANASAAGVFPATVGAITGATSGSQSIYRPVIKLQGV